MASSVHLKWDQDRVSMEMSFQYNQTRFQIATCCFKQADGYDPASFDVTINTLRAEEVRALIADMQGNPPKIFPCRLTLSDGRILEGEGFLASFKPLSVTDDIQAKIGVQPTEHWKQAA